MKRNSNIKQDLDGINLSICTIKKAKPLDRSSHPEIISWLMNRDTMWILDPFSNKHSSYSILRNQLDDFGNDFHFKNTTIKEWRFLLPIWKKKFLKVPTNTNISFWDNISIFTTFLRHILAAELKEFLRTNMPNNYFQKFHANLAETGGMALNVWIMFHHFITEVIFEDFSIDLENTSKDIIEQRRVSGLNILSIISSKLTKYTLMVFDSITTDTQQNPFLLDNTSNTISLRKEVLEILKQSWKALLESKEWNREAIEVNKLLDMVREYSVAPNKSTKTILESLNYYKDIKGIWILWCPAHQAKTKDTTFFNAMFEYSFKCYREYYEYLREYYPDMADTENTINYDNLHEKFWLKNLALIQRIKKIISEK